MKIHYYNYIEVGFKSHISKVTWLL